MEILFRLEHFPLFLIMFCYIYPFLYIFYFLTAHNTNHSITPFVTAITVVFSCMSILQSAPVEWNSHSCPIDGCCFYIFSAFPDHSITSNKKGFKSLIVILRSNQIQSRFITPTHSNPIPNFVVIFTNLYILLTV